MSCRKYNTDRWNVLFSVVLLCNRKYWNLFLFSPLTYRQSWRVSLKLQRELNVKCIFLSKLNIYVNVPSHEVVSTASFYTIITFEVNTILPRSINNLGSLFNKQVNVAECIFCLFDIKIFRNLTKKKILRLADSDKFFLSN